VSELGNALKEAREEKGLSLEDIQDATKIQKRYLVAIEKGDHQLLPGQFYVRAFIKSYAETVGLNVQELFAQYDSEIPKSVVEAHYEIEELSVRKERVKRLVLDKPKTTSVSVFSFLPKVVTGIALVAVIICIYLAVVKVHGGGAEKSSKASQSDDVVLQQGSDIGDHKSKKASTATDNQTSEGKTADKQSGSTDKETPKNDQSDQKKEDAPAQQTLTMTSQSGTASTYSLSDTDKFVVEVTAVDGDYSWLTASKDSTSDAHYYFANIAKDATGQQDAMFKKDLSNTPSVYLKVGNTTGAVVKVNGQVLKYPTDVPTQSLTIHFEKS